MVKNTIYLEKINKYEIINKSKKNIIIRFFLLLLYKNIRRPDDK